MNSEDKEYGSLFVITRGSVFLNDIFKDYGDSVALLNKNNDVVWTNLTLSDNEFEKNLV